MKKIFLRVFSVLVSASMLTHANLVCYAKTNYINPSSSVRPISVVSQKNGEKVVLTGEDNPTIVINNSSKSESRASANSSSSGSSAVTKFVVLAIKLGVGLWGAKLALNLIKTLGVNMSEKISQGFSSLENLFNSENFQKFKKEYEEKSQNENLTATVGEFEFEHDRSEYEGAESVINKCSGVLNFVLTYLKRFSISVSQNMLVAYATSWFMGDWGVLNSKVS